MTDRALEGRHAVVTGGGHGIGAAIAEALARHGARVTLLGRNEAPLAAQTRVCAQHSDAQYVIADVAQSGQVAQAFAQATQAFGRVQILVNNAGVSDAAPFAKITEEHWRRIMSTNVDGVFNCTREVWGAMLEAKEGRVVNIGSAAGLHGYRLIVPYCAAKHAVIGITRALAMEGAKAGVTVNAVCPSYAETEMTATTLKNIMAKTNTSEPEARAMLAKQNPQGRLIQPAEIANAVLWLCLPGTESVTGQSIALAGGELM
jgi:NAD(P)-dependent dehydrogenase (short-subunit alcohol dehydrogenase family)